MSHIKFGPSDSGANTIGNACLKLQNFSEFHREKNLFIYFFLEIVSGDEMISA